MNIEKVLIDATDRMKRAIKVIDSKEKKIEELKYLIAKMVINHDYDKSLFTHEETQMIDKIFNENK